MKNRLTITLMLLAMSILMAGCNLFASSGAPQLPPEEPGEQLVLFADDFADDEIGQVPAKWSLDDPHNLVTVEVVSDPDNPSGKAVRLVGGPSIVDDKHARLVGPVFGPEAEDVKTIVIEHDVQFNLRGSNVGVLNLYVTKSGKHRVHWNVNNAGKLGFVTNTGTGYSTIQVADLKDGWNRVRIIADRELGVAQVYLNDMENPLFHEPMLFRDPIDTWMGAQVIFLHYFRTDYSLDVLYRNVKVSALN